MPLLDALELTKIYGSRKVVNNVGIQVQEGEIVGLLGRNGAGKTTTFRMIMGLVIPDGGTIRFGALDVTRLPVYKRAALGMGFLSQEPSVFQRLTVEQNLLAILQVVARRNGSGHGARARELLDEYGLASLAGQKAFTLSGGEKRRLEICRALLTSPRIILLDEPFAGVDPIAVNELQGLIRSLRAKGISILLTDHNVRETLQVTTRSYIIDHGQVLAQGSPEEIVSNPEVREKYLGEQFRM
jgi:lipopolysaccharide export system ATP-binding protein